MCSTWLLTDTCVCLPLPPGHAHPTSSSHRQFPRIPGGCRLWGELPQQHRGAVTAGPGAAGEQAGVAGGHRLPWVLVGAEHILGNARTRLLAHCTSTPAHISREPSFPPLPLRALHPGTAVLPKHCWPSHDGQIGPHQMPVCSQNCINSPYMPLVALIAAGRSWASTISAPLLSFLRPQI